MRGMAMMSLKKFYDVGVINLPNYSLDDCEIAERIFPESIGHS